MDKEEETPAWAKAEIADAVRILKEDGAHIHKTYAAFQKTLEQKPPENDPKDPPKEGDPPPPKPEPGESSEEKRPGLWWGKRSHDE